MIDVLLPVSVNSEKGLQEVGLLDGLREYGIQIRARPMKIRGLTLNYNKPPDV